MSLFQKHENIFSNEDIEYILNLSEVKNTKKEIDNKNKGSVYFTIDLTPSIKNLLKEKFNLDFSKKNKIPMRWIKGDISPHIDVGTNNFKKTHLIYLNDNPGKFVIDGNSYPITKGSGYVFDEGISHETIETGSEPRLLLGPMSEEGFAVGAATTIYADGQTEVIYFKYFTGPSLFGTYYKINDGTYYGPSLPVTIINTNTSYTLKVLFENDLLFGSDNWYFKCGSENIQFGSESLNSDGSRPIITIDSAFNYPGLIQNGTGSSGFSNNDAFNNIYVYNLKVTTSGGSTLINDAGWIGQAYYGAFKTNNYFINCSSDGPIIDAGGGIVGGYSADASIGISSMYIIGCSSSGNTGQYSGGIIGFNAGKDGGNVTCEYCWSEGNIGPDAGGIFGFYPGNGEGHTYANYCYSTGNIGTRAGGIFGAYAGENIGRNYATGCYSRGNIDTDGGGIYGNNAATGSGTCSATNCYSNGNITTPGNGIFGTTLGSYIESNCYSSNGSWSTSSANLNLAGVPSSVIGSVWVATVTNQPYELLNMGYSPYSLTNIVSQDLKRTYNSTIKQGQSSSSAIVSGLSYEILDKSGGVPSSYSSININSSTGVISSTSSTKPGTYTLYIRNTGSYNITRFVLKITKQSSKKNKKVHVFFNNTKGTTTIINNNCKQNTFYWCS